MRQLARLIDDLLDVSRITSGKIRLKRDRRRRHHPRPGRRVGQAAHRGAASTGSTADFEEGTLPLRADPTRIEQIVVNLLTNAAKYTESGGRIRLGARREASTSSSRSRTTGSASRPRSSRRCSSCSPRANAPSPARRGASASG